VQPDSSQPDLQQSARDCLAQLLGPQALQDIRQAIQQFQSQQQLPVTGFVDANTMSALQAACAQQQAGGQDAGQGGQAPQTGEMGEEEYFLPQGTVLPGRSSWPHPFAPWGPNDEKTFTDEFGKGTRDENKLADAVFYARHPEWEGRRLPGKRSSPDIENLKEEWRFLRAMVEAKKPGASIDAQQHEFDYYGQEPGMHRHHGRWSRHGDTIVVHL
jgi:hypothetical protein